VSTIDEKNEEMKTVILKAFKTIEESGEGLCGDFIIIKNDQKFHLEAAIAASDAASDAYVAAKIVEDAAWEAHHATAIISASTWEVYHAANTVDEATYEAYKAAREAKESAWAALLDASEALHEGVTK